MNTVKYLLLQKFFNSLKKKRFWDIYQIGVLVFILPMNIKLFDYPICGAYLMKVIPETRGEH
jgi:hypothetical protein